MTLITWKDWLSLFWHKIILHTELQIILRCFPLFLGLIVAEKAFITSEMSVVYFNGHCVRSR